MWSEQHVQELEKTIKELREDLEEYDNLNKKIADLITNTANALHGKPLENGLHSWHDLPELVEQLRKERDEARRMYCEEAFAHRFNERRFNERVGLGPIIDPKQIAQGMKWDCFKEDTND